MKKNLITRCLGGIGVGFLCLVASSCKEQPAMMVNNEYKVLKVSTTDKTLSSLYSATIRGRQDIDIYPQVSGFITQLCVEEAGCTQRTIIVCNRPGALSGGFTDSPSQCGSSRSSVKHCKTDVRQQKRITCTKCSLRFRPTDCRKLLAKCQGPTGTDESPGTECPQ